MENKNISSVERGIQLMNKEYKHVLEFGVFEGKSTKRIKDNLDDSFRFIAFDSFLGLPEDWKDSAGKIAGRGVKGRFTTKGKPPNIPGVEFIIGWYEDTIPKYLEIADKCALVHIDCDLYSSTKTVLWGINDYIVKDTILVFDEWIYNHDPKYNDHEQKAFFEWVNTFSRKYEFIDFVDKTQSGEEKRIVKIIK